LQTEGRHKLEACDFLVKERDKERKIKRNQKQKVGRRDWDRELFCEEDGEASGCIAGVEPFKKGLESGKSPL